MGLKEMKKSLIIDSALNLFLEKSISEVTIKDIATNIEVGEATIYRYFENKENIIILCAEKLEKKVYDEYFDLSKFETGYEKLEEFYNNYLYIFENHPTFYRFINEFDAFTLAKRDIIIDEYETIIDKFKDLYMCAYNQGLADNTINYIEDVDTFYYATSKSLLELCKKESTGIDLVRQDKLIDKKKMIKRLIDITTNVFKKEV